MTRWGDFLNKLRPAQRGQKTEFLDTLRSFGGAPHLFWYPASARDLAPLLLDVPGNPTGKRLFRLNASSKDSPCLLWMNDVGDEFANFPEEESLGGEYDPGDYQSLWASYGSRAWIGPCKEVYRFDRRVKLSLFSVRVQNDLKVSHARAPSGDEYLVCFSHCESSYLLHRVFVPCELRLRTVALIKKAGFGQSPEALSHYSGLPEAVEASVGSLGEVDFWVLDIDGQNSEARTPYAECLSRYEYVGGPLRWGWSPARVFARKGAQYIREDRPFRLGRSWFR